MAPPVTSNLLESFVTVGTPLPSLDKADKGEFKVRPYARTPHSDPHDLTTLHAFFTPLTAFRYFIPTCARLCSPSGSKRLPTRREDGDSTEPSQEDLRLAIMEALDQKKVLEGKVLYRAGVNASALAGWAPSTFKSSRANRAGDKSKDTAREAEQFMDEEDLADIASSRTLSTAAAYAPPSSSTYDPLLGVFGPQPGAGPFNEPATAALASLIEPASTRIGAQLMRKMGWRDGQGVGPRVTFDQRRKQAKELGVKLEQEDGEEGGDGEASRHYYAPLDRPLATVLEVGIATDRGWGLGYKAGPSIPSSSSNEQTTKGAARMTMDDDEEDDVYGGSSAPTQGKGGWGVVDVDDMDDGITLLDPTRAGSRQSQKPQKKPAPKKGSHIRESFHDGTNVITGFTLVHDVIPGASTSPLPSAPPRGWVPNPQRLWDEASSTSQDKGKGKQLDATERGTLLGEKAPDPVPKSVFDYLSARDKARIASLTNPSAASTSSSSAPEAPAVPDGPLIIPPLDAVTALAALKGFQPFSANSTSPDPARQARYTLYLQLQARLLPPSDATLPFGPRKFPNGKTQTINELSRELDDYSRAARVFKPVSGMLAGRFTSGGAGGTGPKVEPGLYQPPPKSDLASTFATAESYVAEPERLTPAQTAARAGLFGPLTRTVESFRPEKLVCKRFGVQDPWAGESGDGADEPGGAWKEASRTGFGRPGDRSGVSEVLGKSSMDALMQSAGFKKYQPPEEEHIEVHVPMMAGDVAGSATGTTNGKQGQKVDEVVTLANVGLGDDERQGEETLTYTKAPKDIFAAIFADSDDEDDDDEDEEENGADMPMMVAAPTTVQKIDVVEAEPAPPPPPEPEPDIILTTDNLSSYRPTFTGIKPTQSSGAEADSVKKKKKKAKATKVALSFDVDEGEEPAPSEPKPTKKRRRGEDVKKPKETLAESVAAEAEMEWVEVPQIEPSGQPQGAEKGLSKGPGRAKASDLF
ncbi:G patch domain-containing protein 1, partial [Phenoliferia sp. Uapishka_3]